MIEVDNISLELKGKKILENISLKLEDGSITGLVGNNGCGKTMLMKCICGFVRVDKGKIKSDGKIIRKDIDYLKNAGVIIENPGFIDHYSGMRNLILLAGIKGKADREKLSEAMRLCGLDPELKLPVKKYSLGMRQRLGITQAIMEDQHNLILDEPMNGLDKNGVGDIRKLLLDLKNKGKLILLASHNPADIDALCDVVYEMDNGKIQGCRNRCEIDDSFDGI